MRTRTLVGCLVLGLLCCAFDAAAARVPRVLLVGDSWTGFIQAYKSFEVTFASPDYPGLSNYAQVGYRTAVMGAEAEDYATPELLGRVGAELARYPQIDVIAMTLGGNDVLGSLKPGQTPEQVQARIDEVVGYIEDVIDYCLAQRPDIRVALIGYSDVNVSEPGATVAEVSAVFAQFEAAKLALCQAKDRCHYVHNLGLMQYWFGIPQAEPPVPPMTVPFPGGAPDYTPFPGGDPNYNAPLVSLADANIHLTPLGYDYVVRNALEEAVYEWLLYPKCFQIRNQGGVFRVTFSEPVSGVDASDFVVQLDEGTVPTVSGIFPAAGPDDEYLITLSSSPAGVRLRLADNDSITNAALTPLGGAGAGNGDFAVNGIFAYDEPQPPADDDFDAALAFFAIAAEPYADVLGGLDLSPAGADINGGVASIDPVIINGNGLLDSYEFALIKAILDDDELDLSARGGVTHAQVQAAWNNNLAQILINLGGEEGLAQLILPGLDTFLAGMATLGDPQSSALPVLLLTVISAVDELPQELTGITIPNLANYVLLPQFLGLNGDADGDGFTNKEEYNLFAGESREAYVAAALDPLVPGGNEGEGLLEGNPEGNTEGIAEGEGALPVDLDFCAIMDDTVATVSSPVFAPILELLGDDAVLITLLECAIADLNGPFIDSDVPPDGSPDLPGPNGLLDGSYELAVVAELLNHPQLYTELASGTLPGQVTAGIDVAALELAFNANYNAMYLPLAPLLPVLPQLVEGLAGVTLTPQQVAEINVLFPNLLSVLAGYTVLGDLDSVGIVLFLTDALGEIIQALPDSPDDFQRLDAILSKDGDADGDGYTNGAEYAFFVDLLGSDGATYVAAVLDPLTTPLGGEGEGEGGGQKFFPYDEAVDGDLSGARLQPDFFVADPGSNTLRATQQGEFAGRDIDYFAVIVPPGYVLAQVMLTDYESVPGNSSFVGLQAGLRFTEDPAFANVANLLGGLLYGIDEIGTDVLPALGAFSGAIGFTPPLPAGAYTFWLNETGDASTVALDFVVLPEGTGEGEGGSEGSTEGEGEGTMEGVLEGAIEGVIEGAVEGIAEGSLEGEPCVVGPYHSADTSENFLVELPELLRVIQFFNSLRFGCQLGTVDGYAPGSVDETCCPHDSDYTDTNWRISLQELLRLIQFFNSGGYRLDPQSTSLDGYLPGLAK